MSTTNRSLPSYCHSLPTMQASGPTQAPRGVSTLLDQLKQLGELRSSGTISCEEFDILKQQLLTTCKSAPPRALEPSCYPFRIVNESSASGKRVAADTVNEDLASGKRVASGQNTTKQATLHKFFGPSTIKSKTTGRTFEATETFLTTAERYACKSCGKQCTSLQALISHRKIHKAPQASTTGEASIWISTTT